MEPRRAYGVWVDAEGASELSAACELTVRPGLIYAGVCRTQPLGKHLAHSTIGSLTLMKNLAAILRPAWRLETVAGKTDAKLTETGRQRLRDWMNDHLIVRWTTLRPGVDEAELLGSLDPPLRLVGWRPELTPVRAYIRNNRAELDRVQRGAAWR